MNAHFDFLPKSDTNVFSNDKLKTKAEKRCILKIEANSKNGKIELNDKPNVEPMKISQLIQKQANYFRLY